MKATLNEDLTVAIATYPFLGVSRKNKTIVLFTDPCVGVCVYASKTSGSDLGEFSDDWDMDCFELYTGTITLEND